MRKIFLINGKKRSGKDNFADILVNQKKFTKISIAQSLKLTASRIVNISVDEIDNLKDNCLSFSFDEQEFTTGFIFELIKFSKKYNMTAEMKKRLASFNIKQLDIFIEVDGVQKIDARRFLQNMNVFKTIFDDEDIWINQTIDKINQLNGDIVISDFRFPNECTRIKECFENVTTIKIIGKNFYDMDEYDNHSSETSLNDWKFDYHINNTIWIESSLFWQITALLQELSYVR